MDDVDVKLTYSTTPDVWTQEYSVLWTQAQPPIASDNPDLDVLVERLADALDALMKKGYLWTPAWVAQDSTGEWEAYQYEPEPILKEGGRGFWNNRLPPGEEGIAEHAVLFIDHASICDWKHTLIKLD